jgi:hypothetical protein
MRDRDVRVAIRAKLEADHAGDDNTRIVEEMGIWSGSVRIDVAVINGELSGFELKSAKDNLYRLPQQALLYSDVFDRMTIVTAENHLTGCLGKLPDWWGVTVAATRADAKVELASVRSCQLNPSQNPLQISRLLWRPEVLTILERHELIKGYRSKTINLLHERLAEALTLQALRDEVRACLKARLGWLG